MNCFRIILGFHSRYLQLYHVWIGIQTRRRRPIIAADKTPRQQNPNTINPTFSPKSIRECMQVPDKPKIIIITPSLLLAWQLIIVPVKDTVHVSKPGCTLRSPPPQLHPSCCCCGRSRSPPDQPPGTRHTPANHPPRGIPATQGRKPWLCSYRIFSPLLPQSYSYQIKYRLTAPSLSLSRISKRKSNKKKRLKLSPSCSSSSSQLFIGLEIKKFQRGEESRVMNHHHNHYLADWSSFDQPDHLLSHKKSTGGDNNELVELLWRDGQVVLQTQTPKRIINHNNNNPLSDLIQDDETVSWIHYPFPDAAAAADETEFCSNVLSEFPDFPGSGAPDPNEGISKQPTNHHQQQEVVGKEGSVMTVGSSNRFPVPPTQGFPTAAKKTPPFSERKTAATGTSSSGGSGSGDGSTFSKIGGKRKRSLDFNEESECQSESAELDQSSGLNKAVKLSKSGRRARAAEVHNLSERRRRDRINEKMKALQELIPNSTKTDKASMLDEAIDYLKSLQLQLQVMWMGSGMAAQGVMFPGMQHYMSRLGMGMGLGMGFGMTGHPPVPPHISGGIPLMNNHHQPSSSSSHSHQAVTQLVNNHNNNNHISQAVAAQAAFSDQYAHLMAFHLQPTPSSTQAMNMFRFGSQTAQQQQQQQQQQHFSQNIMAPPPPPPGTSSTGGPSTQMIASQK